MSRPGPRPSPASTFSRRGGVSDPAVLDRTPFVRPSPATTSPGLFGTWGLPGLVGGKGSREVRCPSGTVTLVVDFFGEVLSTEPGSFKSMYTFLTGWDSEGAYPFL